MLKKIAVFILVIILSGCGLKKPPPQWEPKSLSKSNSNEVEKSTKITLDSRLDDLASQISTQVMQKGKKKIAVIEFSNLDGSVTELGKYIAEELITRLFVSGNFEVVERRLLNKVMDEQKLAVTDLLEENALKSLGKILGVDAIVTGTMTDIGSTIKVNSRLISTETALVFAAAAVEIEKDETVKKLFGEVVIDTVDGGKSVGDKSYQPGEFFFKEDFSDVEEGLLPHGWIGGEKLMVESERGEKFLTNFDGLRTRTKQSITVDNISFPNNFRFEWTILQVSGCDHWVELGDIHVYVGPCCGGGSCVIYRLNESEKVLEGSRLRQTVKMSVEKKGQVFKLFIFGNEILMIRIADLEIPSSFTFTLEADSRLYEIVGTVLED